jgi:type IV secretion system protein VirB10
MKRFLVAILFLSMAAPAFSLASQDTYRAAYDIGYADGTAAGKQDYRGSKPFDFANRAGYQDGLNGFDDQIHDRDVFVVGYRRGFEDGYEVGYGLTESAPPAPKPAANPVPPASAQQSNLTGRTVVPAGTQISIRLRETLSSQRNERDDEFRAEVLKGVEVNSLVVIPAGSQIYGTITHVKRAGRIRGRSEMNLRFDEIELPSGSRFPLEATVVSVEEQADEEVKDDEGTIQGTSTKGKDAKKIGFTTGIGALIGVLTGGGSGAKVGAAVGAVGGSAGVLATRGRDIVLPSGTELQIKLDQEVAVPTGLLRPGGAGNR